VIAFSHRVRRTIRLVSILVIASNPAWMLGFGASPRNKPVQTVEQKAAAEKENQRLEELRERITQLQRDLAKSEETRTEAADALKQSESAISEVNRGLFALTQEQNKIAQALGDTQKRSDATRGDVSRQQDLLNRTIRHQYMHGNDDALRLVFDGKDVAESERQLQYFAYLSKARADVIGQLKQSLTQLTELEAAVRVTKDELAANAMEQQKARTTLETERQSRQKVLAQIAGDISKGRREIGRLKRDEDRLSKLVERLAQELARELAKQKAQQAKQREERAAKSNAPGTNNVPNQIRKPGEAVESIADEGFVGRAFETLRGKLKLPTRGELAGRFGAPRESGVTWKGVFIKAESGQQVKAVADGRVVFADWLRGFGNLLIVDHGEGYMSLYGNNETLLKQVGENTQSGENIASVGATGGATESGVYFELRREGKPFDPMQWVAR
jgi:murein hydrolase activator